MDINFESDIVQFLEEDGFLISHTSHQVSLILDDLASGMTIEEVEEEYDLDDGVIAQLLHDLSEAFR